MARSRISSKTIDLQSDNGSVIWSLVQGEQLEFQVALEFLSDVKDYVIEAVVIEAANDGTGALPTSVKSPSPIITSLAAATPEHKGVWNTSVIASYSDIVLYSDTTYQWNSYTPSGAGNVPGVDVNWVPYINNKINIKFPQTLSTTYTVQPSPESPIYGFFELSISQGSSAAFPNIWKPVRGVIEFLFSPTELN